MYMVPGNTFSASCQQLSTRDVGMCADLPEPLLFAYTKYGSRGILKPKFGPLAKLGTSATVLF